MAKIRIKTLSPQLTVDVKLQWKESFHSEQCKLLKDNYTKGLMHLSERTERKAVFTAPANVRIDRFLHTGIDKEVFFQLIIQLINVLRWLNKQKISVSNLELETEYVFVNESTKELFFLYLPIEREEIKGNVRKFLEMLVFESSFEMNVNTDFKQELMNLINSNSNINTKLLEQYVSTYCPELSHNIDRNTNGKSKKLSDSKSEYLRQVMDKSEKENTSDDSFNKQQEKHNAGTDIFYRDVPYDDERAGAFFSGNGDGTVILDEGYGDYGTVLLDEMGGTTILTENNDGTVLLDEGGGTIVLEDNSYDRDRAPKLIRHKTGDVVSVDKPVFRIGKEEGAVDYLIPDNSTVSRTHADIISRDGRYYLYDNNSTNRSYVNNIIVQPLQNVEIYDGTIIRLSDEEFEFRINNY